MNKTKSPEGFIRIKGVSELVGLSESTIRRYAEKGIFPKSIRLTKRTSVWRRNEVLCWLNSLEHM